MWLCVCVRVCIHKRVCNMCGCTTFMYIICIVLIVLVQSGVLLGGPEPRTCGARQNLAMWGTYGTTPEGHCFDHRGEKPGHTWENYGVHSKVFVRSWFSLAMFISTSYTYRIESYIYPAIRDQRADRIDASWYLSSQGMWAKHDENSTYVWFFDFFDMANGIGHHEVEQAVALNALIQFPYGACLKSEAYFWSDPSLRSRSDLASANSAYFSSHSLWKIAMMPWLSIIHSV